jgi:ribonuclease P protein component
MLSQQFRLKHFRDFDTLYKEGRFVGADLLTMKFWKIDITRFPKRAYRADDLKIGFVVGTKVHKSAVKRNRLKRQMREMVRLLLKDEKILLGHLIVFMAKKEMLEQSYEKIEQNIVFLLKRSRLLR